MEKKMLEQVGGLDVAFSADFQWQWLISCLLSIKDFGSGLISQNVKPAI